LTTRASTIFPETGTRSRGLFPHSARAVSFVVTCRQCREKCADLLAATTFVLVLGAERMPRRRDPVISVRPTSGGDRAAAA